MTLSPEPEQSGSLFLYRSASNLETSARPIDNLGTMFVWQGLKCLAVLLLSCIAITCPGASEFDGLKTKAESGDAEAQFALGLIYDLGIDAPRNYAESGKWYLKAANQGLPEAQFKLGVRYFEY